ncbi:uncharacterized protein P174DRAFT_464442 [Aspergillus novofumigatus IBT 16806]|uniref:Peptidase metallopeptidase domain-containing protein n=1 Tax=Aspergillus novofumigatus (strain IBT 16806) TaxID=1392255 RepID=A0A2I1BV85_ASPN1|nr:uncharacterized protein P174DRAFT_464442 [Aspergillus novofumigatus IBT 16806]PKX89303.1 hypothetical protein P174DRAFT_464442 [Aspergillus novofumigatus IBT 16806]
MGRIITKQAVATASLNLDQRTTIDPSRASFFQALKGAVGAEALKTLGPNGVDALKLENLQPTPSSPTTPTKYTRSTQKPMAAAFKDSAHKATLQVGLGKVIPRWKTGPSKTVNLAVFKHGYPKPEWAFLAAAAWNQAAEDWIALDLSVQLKWVSDLEDAVVVLSFAGNQGGVLADASFPNEVDLSVLNVYNGTFRPGTIPYLKNIFLHELGHFAQEMEDETDVYTVQIGPRNPLSFPPQMQPSDVENAKAFYKFSGTSLGWKEARTGRLYYWMIIL